MLERIETVFNYAQVGDKTVSLADFIVLGGCAAVKAAAKAAGHDVEVPFTPSRMEASQEQTDVESFDHLEPAADGFRYYECTKFAVSAEELLVGGMRALNTNVGVTQNGVYTERPGQLTNDFFVHLLDIGVTWKAASDDGVVFKGRGRAVGGVKYTGTRVDLIFGSNSELRALTVVYGCANSVEKFVANFVSAWDKEMSLNRFDVVSRNDGTRPSSRCADETILEVVIPETPGADLIGPPLVFEGIALDWGRMEPFVRLD